MTLQYIILMNSLKNEPKTRQHWRVEIETRWRIIQTRADEVPG